MRSVATLPIRAMIRIFATTYGLSVISTPALLIGEFDRPHDVGHHVHRPATHRAIE